VQETKWRGEKAKEVGERYKIIYSSKNCTRNGVEQLVDEEMKVKLVDVVRKSDRVIVTK